MKKRIKIFGICAVVLMLLAALVPACSADIGEDSDGGGVSDIDEFIDGTDPLDSTDDGEDDDDDYGDDDPSTPVEDPDLENKSSDPDQWLPLGEAFIFVTGGDESWLDDVDAVSDYFADLGWAAAKLAFSLWMGKYCL